MPETHIIHKSSRYTRNWWCKTHQGEKEKRRGGGGGGGGGGWECDGFLVHPRQDVRGAHAVRGDDTD